MAKKKAAKAKSRRAVMKKTAPKKKKAMHPIDREQVCLTMSGINGSLFLPERYVYDSVFARMVDEELTRSRALWPDMGSGANGLHEAKAVIEEEFDEFWDEVKAKQTTPGRAERALKELVQIAAMCRRCAEDVLKVGFE